MKMAQEYEKERDIDRETTSNKHLLPGISTIEDKLYKKSMKLMKKEISMSRALQDYIKSGRNITTWGHLLETLYTPVEEQVVLADLKVINEVFSTFSSDAKELEEGARLLLKHLKIYKTNQLLSNCERYCCALWSTLLKIPESLFVIPTGKKSGDRSLKERFAKMYIQHWEHEPEMRDDISEYIDHNLFKDFQNKKLPFDACLRKLEFMDTYLASNPQLWELYARNLYLELLDAETDKRVQDSEYMYERLRLFLSAGVNMTEIALQNCMLDCRATRKYLKYFQKINMNSSVSVTFLNGIIRKEEMIFYSAEGEKNYADMLLWILNHLEIQKDDPQAAGEFLEKVLRVATEEEFYFVKETGLFSEVEIGICMEILRKKKAVEWIPLMIQWKKEERRKHDN